MLCTFFGTLIFFAEYILKIINLWCAIVYMCHLLRMDICRCFQSFAISYNILMTYAVLFFIRSSISLRQSPRRLIVGPKVKYMYSFAWYCVSQLYCVALTPTMYEHECFFYGLANRLYYGAFGVLQIQQVKIESWDSFNLHFFYDQG